MKVFFSLLLLASPSVHSQTLVADKPVQQRSFIEVVRTAGREVRPDKIILSVTLSEKDNGGNKYSIDQQDTNLKKILAGMSIPLSKLVLGDVSSELITEKKKEQTAKRSKEYNLELGSADQVSAFLQKLSDAGIREVSIISVDHSKIDSLRKEVRISAIRAAKEKAIYLTAAIGEQVDQPLEIREQDQFGLINYPQLSNTTLYANGEPGQSKADFRLLKISSSMYIKYALK